MWPIRGDTAIAAVPNTGMTRKFSVRYWITTRPFASWSGNGGSTTIFAAGCSASGTTGLGPSVSRADETVPLGTADCSGRTIGFSPSAAGGVWPQTTAATRKVPTAPAAHRVSMSLRGLSSDAGDDMNDLLLVDVARRSYPRSQ